MIPNSDVDDEQIIGGEFDTNNKSSQENKIMLNNCCDEKNRQDSITDDTTCGYWIFKGRFLQKFANKKAYVVLFGLLGCLFSASYAYFNGIISTVEKRFGIPSKVSGIITIGNDVSQLFVSVFITYYASRKHQPRWIGFGSYTIVLFCLLSALPHFIYGPGNDALSLTEELGASPGSNAKILEGNKVLCQSDPRKCDPTSDNITAPVILFLAQFVSGLGASLYHTLGISYMDDNVKRSKTPLLLSFSYFIRGLGPVLGYVISSICLKIYIAPTLTPTITTSDPRWLGAWWLGWLFLAGIIFLFSTLITMFPRTLPNAAMRKNIEAISNGKSEFQDTPKLPASFSDMMETFVRLFTNKTLICNNLASVFYLLGFMPFFIFLPKYMEVIYVQSASFANLITGTVGLAFTAVGIFSSGIILSKYKPRARPLAAWNVFIGVLMVAGVIAFAFLECSDVAKSTSSYSNSQLTSQMKCNVDCHCDYVKYTPVCSSDGKTNFISPCHAGCKTRQMNNNSQIYTNCSCVKNIQDSIHMNLTTIDDNSEMIPNGTVTTGACKVNCQSAFILFLSVVCFLHFVGATGKTTNFLVGVRCVEEKDKSVAMGLGLTIMSLAGFIPSPILFGYIIDKSCIVWGKTCSGKGHCWLYNSKMLRQSMNLTAAFFIAIGVIFDMGVWYYVKDVQIFDEEIKPTDRITKIKNNKTKNNAIIQ